jgi:uncharacterized membrane protein
MKKETKKRLITIAVLIITGAVTGFVVEASVINIIVGGKWF